MGFVDLTYLLHSNEKFWSSSRICYNYIPCMIRSSRGIYNIESKSILNKEELFKFQGFIYSSINLPENFSEIDVRKLTGNSMSICILKILIKKIFSWVN